jgi:hypothetical protein
MSVKNSMQFIPLTSIDSATFTGSYQAINSTGTPFPCFAFKLVNNSTKDVTVSYDGTNDHDYVPTATAVIYDLMTNKQPQNDYCALKHGTIVYVKGSAGTGSVYLVGLYQPQGV